LESDITFHIGKQEAELALRVNSAAYHGDLYQLKGFIRAGADPNRTDYDGRSPLVWETLIKYMIALILLHFLSFFVLSKSFFYKKKHLSNAGTFHVAYYQRWVSFHIIFCAIQLQKCACPFPF